MCSVFKTRDKFDNADDTEFFVLHKHAMTRKNCCADEKNYSSTETNVNSSTIMLPLAGIAA